MSFDKRNISIKVKNLFELIALIQRDMMLGSSLDLHAGISDNIEIEGALLINALKEFKDRIKWIRSFGCNWYI